VKHQLEPRELLHYFYDQLCEHNLPAAVEALHPDYKSLTSEVEPSRQAFIDYYTEVAKLISSFERKVQLVIEDSPWIGIIQIFDYKYHDDSEERYHSADFYRVQDGLFIEHQGVTNRLD